MGLSEDLQIVVVTGQSFKLNTPNSSLSSSLESLHAHCPIALFSSANMSVSYRMLKPPSTLLCCCVMRSPYLFFRVTLCLCGGRVSYASFSMYQLMSKCILPRILVIWREASGVRRLCDFCSHDLVQGVEALAAGVERVHEMHLELFWCLV